MSERDMSYYDPKRRHYFAADNGWVRQEIPGNVVPICQAVHGQPQAEMIADALNEWECRHDKR